MNVGARRDQPVLIVLEATGMRTRRFQPCFETIIELCAVARWRDAVNLNASRFLTPLGVLAQGDWVSALAWLTTHARCFPARLGCCSAAYLSARRRARRLPKTVVQFVRLALSAATVSGHVDAIRLHHNFACRLP